MRTLPRLLRAASLLALAATGCVALGLKNEIEPQWVETNVEVVDLDNLHEVCLQAVTNCGLGIAKSSVAEGRIESRWLESLMPFRSPGRERGFRRRATVLIEKASASAPVPRAGLLSRLVRVRVEREQNAEKTHPGKSESAIWEPVDDDIETSRRIAITVQNQMTDFEPSDDFYRRHGFPSANPKPSDEKPGDMKPQGATGADERRR